jgi:hypothetical protein
LEIAARIARKLEVSLDYLANGLHNARAGGVFDESQIE